MLNKDKRSLVLSMCLSDGCLHYYRQHGKLYGGMTLCHCAEQKDYLEWKASLISRIMKSNAHVRPCSNGRSGFQIQFCNKKFRVWRRFTYLNGKKDIAKMLPFIRHPKLAIGLMLLDDGYVEPSITNGKDYSASLRLCLYSQTIRSLETLQAWLEKYFGLKTKIRFQRRRTRNKSYPFIKINCSDSLRLWHKLRGFILSFKAMPYKFRCLESIYQQRYLQRDLGDTKIA